MKFFKKNKKGFTLIEILLIVGFIALAGLSIYSIYGKVKMSSSALTEGKNLDTLRAGVKNLYGNTQTYVGLTNAILNDARATPDSMRIIPYTGGSTSIINTFGGTVTVLPTSLGGGTNNGFQITYANVPGEVCTKLIMGTGSGWNQITVSSGVIKVFGTNSISIPGLATACSADTGTGLTIKFDSL